LRYVVRPKKRWFWPGLICFEERIYLLGPKKVVVVGIIRGEADKAIGGGVDQPQASSGTDRCVGAAFAPTVGIFRVDQASISRRPVGTISTGCGVLSGLKRVVG